MQFTENKFDIDGKTMIAEASTLGGFPKRITVRNRNFVPMEVDRDNEGGIARIVYRQLENMTGEERIVVYND